MCRKYAATLQSSAATLQREPKQGDGGDGWVRFDDVHDVQKMAEISLSTGTCVLESEELETIFMI